IAAPFGDPGTRIGRFSVRASRHGDVRVDPGSVQVQVPGGMLVATAAGPEEDVRGLL
ncbi:MAG: hypothetical protein GWO02_17360, partial [Gammaproteobacteria bacterium]|nr:hypothetical protein [Gammaproteobacteria bacterium]